MGRSTILADNNMFQVRPEDYQTLINKERETELHHTVARLIYLMSRAKKDIKTSIDFLCTWVRSPDKDEWKNIVRVIRYTRGTVHLPLIPRADVLGFIKWWVDASFDAQSDCKGNTGTMMFMGSGLIMEILWKKKKWEELNRSRYSGSGRRLATVPVIEILY